MSVVVVGLDQRQAPLELLERVTIGDDALDKALCNLRDRSNLSEVAVLSTCQRTEIYAVVERFHDGVAELEEFLATTAGVPLDTFQELLTVRFDDDVAGHLFAVAAGLESALVGESEVLGQVRRAWERARRERASGPVLAALFRHAVETGKRVRSETAIGRGITSLSHGAVALAAEQARPAGVVGGLAGSRVLVIGAGEMGEGVLAALAARPPGERPAAVTVANRTPSRARDALDGLDDAGFASTCGVAGFDRLGDLVASHHVIFSSVATTRAVLDVPLVSAARQAVGSDAPLLVVDLGVPRNVDPEVGELAGVTLLDMDVLTAAVARAIEGRQSAVRDAGDIVAAELDRYQVATRARSAAPVVAALRARAEAARSSEIERRRTRRRDLTDAQWQQVDEVTRSVVAKLLHEPTVAVKGAAGTPRGERLVEALRALFDL